ncbi:MAG: guanylate kinase [Bacteroidota bacterium]|nr:guanylate kinase [Bacteroidota bacterium]
MQTNKLIVFSAPSGAGKTSIVKYLLDKSELKLAFSISATSRQPRTGETHGKDYYFISTHEFKKRIEQGQFLEWEEVYTDNYYGTLKSEVERIWAEGYTVIFDIDVIGGLNIKKLFPEKTLTVFVEPPSIDELEKRLRMRSTETEEKIQMRVNKAAKELESAPLFDVRIKNDILEVAQQEAYQVISNFIKS